MFNQYALKSISPNFYCQNKVMSVDCFSLNYEGYSYLLATQFSAFAGGSHLKYNIIIKLMTFKHVASFKNYFWHCIMF